MPPSHAGIEVRPGPRFRARAAYGGRRLVRSFASLPAALAWRAHALDALRAGEEPPAPALPPPSSPTHAATVEDAARALVCGMLAGSVRTRTGTPFKPSVARKYEAMLRVHVLPRAGLLPLAGLARGDVQQLVDGLAAERGAETARKALTALRVALRVAERDGLLDANPCAGVRVPANGDGERPARILTPDEAAAILAAAEAQDAALGRSLAGPIVALAFGTGLRSGELLALHWGASGLDLDRGTVRVTASLDRDRGADGAFALVPPKSRASRREVPLPPSDLPRLLRHRLATGRPADGALVFADERGRPLNAKGSVRCAWRAAVRSAAVAEPLPTLHDARHAYASHALRAGLTLHAVARLLGHSGTALVERRYGHALPDELAGAGLALDGFRAARS